MCKCLHCDNPPSKGHNGYCYSCYKYFSSGGTLHELPKRGVVGIASNKKIICHICGKAFDKLGGHICQQHKISVRRYKEQFNIRTKSKLTSDNYQRIMKDYVKLYYDKVVKHNLNTEAAKRNRFVKGTTIYKTRSKNPRIDCN